MLCLICVRSGSRGLKGKNLKKIKNKTLLQITIDTAKKIKQIKNIIVSTDSKYYAKLSEKYGAKVLFIRPKYLSTSKSFEWDVWKHAVNFMLEKNYIISILSKMNVIDMLGEFDETLTNNVSNFFSMNICRKHIL